MNFSGQDLRNRSFKGEDLEGADFSGADIRGCDFSEARLRGANFSGVQVGVSRQKIWSLIARSGGVAIAVTLAGAIAGTFGAAGTGLVAIAITRGEASIIAAAMAGASAYVGCSGLLIFLAGDFTRGILLAVGAAIAFGFAAILFWEVVKQVEKLTVTSFKDADLTGAIFDNIENVDLSGARGYRGKQ